MTAATFSPRRVVCLIALALTTIFVLAGPVHARVIDQEHYADTESFSFADCGTTFDAVSEFSGHALFRVDKGGEAFLVKDTFRYRTVITNRATGEFFVLTGHGLFHEIKATQVSGTVYEFVAIEAGQPFVILDAAGNVVVRDRGVIRRTALLDTLGDGEPGAEFLEIIDITVHGPHPGFGEDFDFCAVALALTTP